jgi:hypothetical protein
VYSSGGEGGVAHGRQPGILHHATQAHSLFRMIFAREV